MNLFISILFWGSGGLLFYTYLGYPLLIWLLARLFPKPIRKGPYFGKCSVVIAAHNEAHHLPAKLGNLLQMDGDCLREILIGSDGSDDNTVPTVQHFIQHHVKNDDLEIRIVDFPERRGKAAVLNDLVTQCGSDIVVFMDARQEIKTDAVDRLMENFADPTVGAVSGDLVFKPASGSTAQGMSVYWCYEKFIRKSESRFGSVPGATGALYAIRTRLFEPMPPTAILDDVVIPISIIRKGYRCVISTDARLYDTPSNTSLQESIRKRRTIAGNLQLAWLFPQWLIPWRNPVWWQFVSHKMMRLVSPHMLFIFLLSSGLLRHRPLPFALFAGQVLFYTVGLMGVLGVHNKLFIICAAFLRMNLHTLQAVNDVIRGRSSGAWNRT